jgi:hypothetical protein
VDVERSRVANPGLAPDPVEQRLTGDGLAGALHQRRQQVELSLGQLDRLAGQPDQPRRPVSDLQPLGGWIGLAALERLSSQDGPHSGHQLAEAERLDDVIVRPQLEAQDPLELLPPGGEHDDRDR